MIPTTGQQQFRAFTMGQRPFLDTQFSDQLRDLHHRRKHDPIPPTIALKFPHLGSTTQGEFLLNMEKVIWRPSSLSELTPKIFNTGLTHLGLEASI